MLAASVAAAQELAAPASTDQISVNYVLVPFVPLDRSGKPLLNVKKRDVRLLVDGQPVATDMFERTTDAPVSFTILLDGSGSMGLAGKMEGAIEALRTLILSRKPGDDYALYLSAAGTVSEVVPFTTDGSKIITAMRRIEPFGKTRLFDAVVRMPDKTILGTNGSRAIILLTDGLDNASEIERRQMLEILSTVDVPIYPLGLVSRELLLPGGADLESRLDLGVLGDLARMTGGRVAIATEPEALRQAVRAALVELRAQYLIGFSPTPRGAIRYRRISLEVGGRAESVRVRSGYRGTEPPRIAPSKFRSR